MGLRRNNLDMPLTNNGPRRNGQFEWHNEQCQIEDYGIKGWPPYRLIWCATHGQWASEVPIRKEYLFADGTRFTLTDARK